VTTDGTSLLGGDDNAAEAIIQANGHSVHTGTAKDVMVNASKALLRVHQLIPPQDRPEFTQGREGFFYLERIEGDCEDARADYIIRDHDRTRFEARKALLRSAVDQVNAAYALRPSAQVGQPVLSIDIRDQYRNMAEVITRPENAHLIESARRAYAACGVTMRTVPMRGGTDGAQLSFRGLPCPNLSACYHNAHGVTEFVPVRELETMVDVLQALVGIYAEGGSAE
jgi:tripeptide aminopeptidase